MKNRTFSSTLLTESLQNPLIPLVLGIGLLLLTGLIALNVWRSFQINTTANTRHRPPAIHSLAQVSQWHLFGRYDPALGNLPNTQLNIILQGTILSNITANSRALISSNKGATKVYRIGQRLPSGAVIQRILQDRVILESDGNLQSLRLPIKTIPGITIPARTEE